MQLKTHFGGWRQPHLMWRERPRFLVAAAPVALPSSVDLAPEFPRICDQGQEGSCTAFSWTGNLWHMAMKEGLPWATLEPSEQAFYYQERVHGGYDVNQDTGASLADGAWVAMNLGCIRESDWPYSQPMNRVPPMYPVIDLATVCLSVNQDLTQIKTALAEGFGVNFGVVVYSSFEDAKGGIIPMPDTAAEEVLGGHALVLVGYDDSTSRFKFRNSWGLLWGDAGYGYLPYDYVADPDLASDFWTPRKVQ